MFVPVGDVQRDIHSASFGDSGGDLLFLFFRWEVKQIRPVEGTKVTNHPNVISTVQSKPWNPRAFHCLPIT
jgi:hypothetical protein